MKHLAVILIILLLVSGCGRKEEKPLVIGVGIWVGFMPLLYARDKGLLDSANIKLYVVSTIGELVHLYDSGLIDGFAATQVEAGQPHDRSSLVPVLLFDRSCGGDMIMANFTEEDLSKDSEPVYLYYKPDTVSDILLESFKNRPFFRKVMSRLQYVSINQAEINPEKLTSGKYIVITFSPYDAALSKKGFRTILSSKDAEIPIIDALFVTSGKTKAHRDDFRKIKAGMSEGLKALNKDPEGFYRYMKNYTEGQSFSEFMTSINTIQWLIGMEDTPEANDFMKAAGLRPGELCVD